MASIPTKLLTPHVPNYILHEVGPRQRQEGIQIDAPKSDIADLSDAVLEEIAADWRVALLARAAERRRG